MYELKYVYELEPVEQPQAIERGLSYHEAVEGLLKHAMDYKYIPDWIENTKIRAMVFAFNIHVFDKLLREGVVLGDIERWISYKTESGHTVIGRTDAVTKRNEVIEHKTTSGLIDATYFQRLEFDEQIPTYMIATHSNEIYYTVCSTPTIRQKKNETEDEFFTRCVRWYDEDTESKISVIKLYRSDEELASFAKEQDAVINEMANCKVFYRNPNHCMKWGRLCEYAPVCMHYDPSQQYVQFKRKEESN